MIDARRMEVFASIYDQSNSEVREIRADIVDEFLAFVGDDMMIIHNASFDMGFLNVELKRLDRPVLPLSCLLYTSPSPRDRG